MGRRNHNFGSIDHAKDYVEQNDGCWYEGENVLRVADPDTVDEGHVARIRENYFRLHLNDDGSVKLREVDEERFSLINPAGDENLFSFLDAWMDEDA